MIKAKITTKDERRKTKDERRKTKDRRQKPNDNNLKWIQTKTNENKRKQTKTNESKWQQMEMTIERETRTVWKRERDMKGNLKDETTLDKEVTLEIMFKFFFFLELEKI